MKIQIRQGIFETNSSSEHSLTLMDRNNFYKWKNGELLATVKYRQNDNKCWGNFWSRMNVLEFTDDFENALKENEKTISRYIESGINMLEKYKSDCLNHKKLVERELSNEEYEALTDEEQDKYADDLYEDSLYVFDEESYNNDLEYYKSLNKDNFIENVGLIKDYWFTYEDFMNDLKIDCQSPFEHEDIDMNVYIIGKYFHS